jgi:hypothetical protein
MCSPGKKGSGNNRYSFWIISCAAGLALFSSPRADGFFQVDSLAGRAEIQRAGQSHWESAGKGTKLANNDCLRTLDKSTAQLRNAEGDTAIVRGNSQLFINVADDPVTGVLTRHVTVLFGAALFVVQKVLPKAFTHIRDFKAYSPTAVVAVRGTTFTMEVDKSNGSTLIRTLEGTVLVRNILRNTSFYLAYPFETTVSIQTDPAPAVSMTREDLDLLMTWAPKSLVEGRIAEQIASGRTDRQKMTNTLSDKVVVIPFMNKSVFKGSWDISTGVAQAFASRMIRANAGSTVIVAGNAGADPLETGKVNKARYVITGAVDELDISQRAEVDPGATRYREYNTGIFKTTIQLIDVQEKKVVYDGAFAGSVSRPASGQTSWTYIGGLAFNPEDKAFADCIVGMALKQNLEQATAAVMTYLPF